MQDASRDIAELEITDSRVRDLRRPNEHEQGRVIKALDWLENPIGSAKSLSALTSILGESLSRKATTPPERLAGTANRPKWQSIASREDKVIEKNRTLLKTSLKNSVISPV